MKLVWLDPQPVSAERPALMPSPFDEMAPHALARRCAEVVMNELRTSEELSPGLPTALLRGPTGGKMFGVLAFEASDGRVGFIRALSGQLERAWNVEGYAEPLFDAAARAAFEPVAEGVVKQFTARVEAARADADLLAVRAELSALDAFHAERRVRLKEKHAANKVERRERRAKFADAQARADGTGEAQRSAGAHAAQAVAESDEVAGENALAAQTVGESATLTRAEVAAEKTESHALDQLSRADDAERRRNEVSSREERAAVLARLAPKERHLAALERLRRIISREAMRKIWDTYVLTSFSGDQVGLRELFSGDPPSGAADCAAPRLLDAARRQNWKPLALAEFWWGAPPPGGARVEGAYYPACREKCGPVLPFLMRGLQVAPKHVWTPPAVPDALELRFEDARFIVVDKPAGLLSVPARDERIDDNVLARVKRRFPKSTPFAVHRLDLDTSGLLLVALDLEVYRLLQRQFLSRAVEKKYVAVLDGELAATRDEGVIELPLRVDLDQRPRQLVDFEHGRAALTRWKVLERAAGQTRVAFSPLTGRTHQLRVHAAHAQGLSTPIVGDRLYGHAANAEASRLRHAAARLLLHAESLRLRHPFDGTELNVHSDVPF